MKANEQSLKSCQTSRRASFGKWADKNVLKLCWKRESHVCTASWASSRTL